MTDIFSKEKRKELMSRVRNRNTDIELRLRKRLWREGFRYRVNYPVFGKPDIAFPKQKLAIFCDGDFWHGRNYKLENKGYKQFWKDKISNNIKRDIKVNKQLKKDGWIVLRFWKTEILKEPSRCIDTITRTLS